MFEADLILGDSKLSRGEREKRVKEHTAVILGRTPLVKAVAAKLRPKLKLKPKTSAAPKP